MEKIFEIYIKTTPERLWHAITDPEQRAKYMFDVIVRSDWTTGSRWSGTGFGQTQPIFEGNNVEVDPPRRLVQTFNALFAEEVKAEPASRLTWEIEQVGDSYCLTLTHDQLREGAPAGLYGGWPQVLSGLKTWLETGELLTTYGSLRYANR